jgi:hypothetical protein
MIQYVRLYPLGMILTIGTAQAVCPLLNSDEFGSLLTNESSRLVRDGISYEIINREMPAQANPVSQKAQVEVREKNSLSADVCDYKRRLGTENFGSFTLKEEEKRADMTSPPPKPETYPTWGEERFNKIISTTGESPLTPPLAN